MGDILNVLVVHYIEVVSKEDLEARYTTSASRSVVACWTWASSTSRTAATVAARTTTRSWRATVPCATWSVKTTSR
eukprot:4863788-Heterocapsa_arctica.AAC.1